ncbi:carbohydrate ABC transporter membrane protein 1, CUT1 family [Trichormus variabilis ATCC 29413]|uniref:Carbohydrate ABC transporter membrane protein 1, CUT1 family n=2 Tax=Anabaena variabilis TaxID=264691 RepID=Q3MFZ9_TRIV2|nr:MULTISPECIES: sugar ABC transporter permease [Nostocaceae]ABA20087.1 carbohydrate ABC transporter membrane protein 1, CUT1 family [Trichormus variabilis ATCC 29413]MBC1214697.1 sugar ABC transporter permease [Trichormus variabilis ARAD]MBC1255380.1 sugar ABC transporter permease [Trichormus variabilis V5]MBC1268660.1 sugar ABC transporter permease [Trichormus variabilis FSR]MBC1303617.1 sugar ABC transporter permease [Trichormus variabilis N2B]
MVLRIRRWRNNHRRNITDSLFGYVFMMPTLLVLGTFVVLPILYSVFLSLNKVQLLGGVAYQFIGLRNFQRLVDDQLVWIALRNTAEYVVIVVPSQTILALILAVTLNAGIRGKNWWRILYFLPTVTSSAVLTLIFMWIYNTDGLLNDFLAFVGLPTYNWLGDPAVALKGIMLMNIWSTAPFYMVIYLAALQDIPAKLYEAAELDGANWWQKFIYITIPLLKPVTFFVIAVGVIGTFQLFDQSYIFSGGTGGPNNATLTVVLLIYQMVFRYLQMGYAAAIAFLLAVVIIAITLIQRRVFAGE